MEMTALIDHHNYELKNGRLPTDTPGIIIHAQHLDRTRFIHPSSHVLNAGDGGGKSSNAPSFKLWMVNTAEGAVPGDDNLYISATMKENEYGVGERVIPAGWSVWGQAMGKAEINYFFTIKEQLQ
jgi:hypothetical protein